MPTVATRWRATFAALAVLAAPAAARAQRILGSDDASVVRLGVLRVRIGAEFTDYRDLYASSLTGTTTTPLGGLLTLDTLGTTQLPFLVPTQSRLAALTADPAYRLSLGAPTTDAEVRSVSIPLTLELGILPHVQFGASLPYVKNTTEITFNPRAERGNVGLNPAAFGDPGSLAQATQLGTELTAASGQLQAKIDNCSQNPGDPSCAGFDAATAQALVNEATSFATDEQQVYGSSPVIPTDSSAAQKAINARITDLTQRFGAFGVSGIDVTSLFGGFFVGQQQMRLVFADSLFGLVGSPIQTVTRSHIGDLELSAKILLFDTFGNDPVRMTSPKGLNLRASVTGLFRLGSGESNSPDDLFDVGTGDGQNDIEGRATGDLLFGSRFWVTGDVRYTDQLKDRQAMRITSIGAAFLPEFFRRQMVNRDLGNVIQWSVTPRYVLTNYFSVEGTYLYRHKMQDSYTGTFTVTDQLTGEGTTTLDASIMDANTAQIEERGGFGITYSTQFAASKKPGQLPYEVSYFHSWDVRGAGVTTPALSRDDLAVRVYFRMWGK